MPVVPSRGRRLVLHFDINNTILIRDNAKKMGSVNSLSQESSVNLHGED